MFRRKKVPTEVPQPLPDLDAAVDWNAVPPRLRGHVDDALESFDRWRRLVGRTAVGPLRDRLDGWTFRLDDVVQQIVATATQVGEIEAVLRTLDPQRVTDELKAAKRAAAGGPPPAELGALEARFASVQRMMNAVADAEERLRVLDVRLGAVVAQGAEVAMLGTDAGGDRMDADLDALAVELDALRGALGDLGSS